MALEIGEYIDDLVATNPTGADDRSTADDHIRLLKSTIKASFPNITGAMTATQVQLSYSVGVTSAIQTQLDGKQAADSDLTAIAGLANTDGNFIVGDGTNWIAESGATVMTSLGLGALAVLDTVASGQIDADAVTTSEIDFSSPTRTSATVPATSTWTPPVGLYTVVYAGGGGGTVWFEINVSGTWRRSSTALVDAMTFHTDGTNARFIETGGFARTLYYLKLA